MEPLRLPLPTSPRSPREGHKRDHGEKKKRERKERSSHSTKKKSTKSRDREKALTSRESRKKAKKQNSKSISFAHFNNQIKILEPPLSPTSLTSPRTDTTSEPSSQRSVQSVIKDVESLAVELKLTTAQLEEIKHNQHNTWSEIDGIRVGLSEMRRNSLEELRLIISEFTKQSSWMNNALNEVKFENQEKFHLHAQAHEAIASRQQEFSVQLELLNHNLTAISSKTVVLEQNQLHTTQSLSSLESKIADFAARLSPLESLCNSVSETVKNMNYKSEISELQIKVQTLEAQLNYSTKLLDNYQSCLDLQNQLHQDQISHLRTEILHLLSQRNISPVNTDSDFHEADLSVAPATVLPLPTTLEEPDNGSFDRKAPQVFPAPKANGLPSSQVSSARSLENGASTNELHSSATTNTTDLGSDLSDSLLTGQSGDSSYYSSSGDSSDISSTESSEHNQTSTSPGRGLNGHVSESDPDMECLSPGRNHEPEEESCLAAELKLDKVERNHCQDALPCSGQCTSPVISLQAPLQSPV